MKLEIYKLVALGLGAFAFTLFISGIGGKREKVTLPGKAIGSVETFHDKGPIPTPTGSWCTESEGCHSNFPHTEDVIRGPFSNMHTITIDCIVCHRAGKIEVSAQRIDGKILIRQRGENFEGDPHKEMGEAITCRGCHSSQGRKEFENMTGLSFEKDFIDPYPLKLIEEGGSKWEFPGY